MPKEIEVSYCKTCFPVVKGFDDRVAEKFFDPTDMDREDHMNGAKPRKYHMHIIRGNSGSFCEKGYALPASEEELRLLEPSTCDCLAHEECRCEDGSVVLNDCTKADLEALSIYPSVTVTNRRQKVVAGKLVHTFDVHIDEDQARRVGIIE